MTQQNIDLRIARQDDWVVILGGTDPDMQEIFRLTQKEAISFGECMIRAALLEIQKETK